MFSSFIAITVWSMRNESILKNSYRHLPSCTYIITVTNTAKVNKYARKGSVVHSTLSHNKIAFPFQNLQL